MRSSQRVDYCMKMWYSGCMPVASAKDLFPSIQVRTIASPATPGWSAFNPSIAKNPAGDIKLTIRHSQYIIDSVGRYTIADASGVIKTKHSICGVNDDLVITSMDEIDTSEVDIDIKYPMVLGMEDARLAWYNDCWCLYGTLRQHREDGRCAIVEDELIDNRVFNRVVYESPFDVNEKNWMLMTGGYFTYGKYIYSCYPSRVYDSKTHELLLPDNPAAVRPELMNLRGSSQAIPCDGGYLAVTHEVDWSGVRRQYYSRFIWFDVYGFMQAATDAFWIISPTIEFACGLIEHHGNYVMTFGKDDAQAMMAVLPASEVVQQLKPARLN